MTHNESVTAFLAGHGITMEQALNLSATAKAELDKEFRAQRAIEFGTMFNDANAIKISRAAFRRFLPVGMQCKLVFAMGELVDKARTVKKHDTVSIQFNVVKDGKDTTSWLRFESGETYSKWNDILTVSKDGAPTVRYQIFPDAVGL